MAAETSGALVPPPHQATRRRVHGRRKGRQLSSSQQAALARIMPVLRLDLGKPAPSATKLGSLFARPVDQVLLEIGFGGGEHLIWQALYHPEAGVIGAEPFVNGVASLVREVEKHGLADRVRVHDDDATSLLHWLPTGSIDRVFMLFPDPWPKLRHRTRRFLSADTLGRIAELLKPGGQFRFASDIADYSGAARDLCDGHPELRCEADFTSEARHALADWPQTRYEAKALAAGRHSTFLMFRKV